MVGELLKRHSRDHMTLPLLYLKQMAGETVQLPRRVVIAVSYWSVNGVCSTARLHSRGCW